MISQQSQYELPQSPTFIGGIYDVMEWSTGHSGLHLDGPSNIQILNWRQHFRLFYRELLVMIEFDASILRSFTIDVRYEAAVCSVEYDIGWNRPDIKSTALT